MFKQLSQILLFILIIPVQTIAQETDYGPGYQTIMLSNPAFTGSEGDGMLRLSYLNFYPGNNYNLHSVFLSYDSYMPVIHGGAGFYLSDDYLGGIINDIRGGFSYAYHMQAGKNTFINAGLSASFYHRGYSFGNAILPDQIDPLEGVTLPSGEILSTPGFTVFDIGAGFLYSAGKMSGGFSISHLAEPYLLSSSGLTAEKLKRKYLLHLTRQFFQNNNNKLKVQPVLLFESQGGFFTTGTGAVFEINSLSFNAVVLANSKNNLDIQTGFSIKTGIIFVFYNYRFNIVSDNKLLPLSLLHQTGVAFSLYNVDKRKIVKTINFLKL